MLWWCWMQPPSSPIRWEFARRFWMMRRSPVPLRVRWNRRTESVRILSGNEADVRSDRNGSDRIPNRKIIYTPFLTKRLSLWFFRDTIRWWWPKKVSSPSEQLHLPTTPGNHGKGFLLYPYDSNLISFAKVRRIRNAEKHRHWIKPIPAISISDIQRITGNERPVACRLLFG